jgi:transcriptional regulator with XRE-family HTH domain
MQSRHDSYIRSYRKKARLSQEDVAFLLGGTSGTSVSRHERGRRAPTVETALAYEVILGKPIGELYRRFLTSLRRDIAKRAEQLLQTEVPKEHSGRASHVRRRAELRRIAKEHAHHGHEA